MDEHNELDDRNSLTSHGSTNADNDKVGLALDPFVYRLVYGVLEMNQRSIIAGTNSGSIWP